MGGSNRLTPGSILTRLCSACAYLKSLTVPGARSGDWFLDGSLVFMLSTFCVMPYFWGQSLSGWPIATVSLIMVLPLIFRRHYPLLMLFLTVLAGLIQVILAPVPVLSIISIPIVSYSVGRWVEGPVSRLTLVAGVLGSIMAPARWLYSNGRDPDSYLQTLPLAIVLGVACMGAVTIPYLVGGRVQLNATNQASQLAAAAERYRLAVAEREQYTRRVEVTARARIARELHDIVAHSLAVMIVQAEGGRAQAAKNPQAAAETLDTIAETGRDALTEMRRIVGVLRGDDSNDDSDDYTPTPGLVDIKGMAERAGERVIYQQVGELAPVSQGLGLTCYRVAQEGITNFIKHAGPSAEAEVGVECTPEKVRVWVRDNGRGASVADDGGGHGLPGMYERVSAMGGILYAGPKPGGGFLVEATLPNANPAI